MQRKPWSDGWGKSAHDQLLRAGNLLALLEASVLVHNQLSGSDKLAWALGRVAVIARVGCPPRGCRTCPGRRPPHPQSPRAAPWRPRGRRWAAATRPPLEAAPVGAKRSSSESTASACASSARSRSAAAALPQHPAIAWPLGPAFADMNAVDQRPQLDSFARQVHHFPEEMRKVRGGAGIRTTRTRKATSSGSIAGHRAPSAGGVGVEQELDHHGRS